MSALPLGLAILGVQPGETVQLGSSEPIIDIPSGRFEQSIIYGRTTIGSEEDDYLQEHTPISFEYSKYGYASISIDAILGIDSEVTMEAGSSVALLPSRYRIRRRYEHDARIRPTDPRVVVMQFGHLLASL